MKPNMCYGIKPVNAAGLVQVFGTAGNAIRATGGKEKCALFFIHNPSRAQNCSGRAERESGPLLAALSVIWESERVDRAASAYNLAGTIASIRQSVCCGLPMAWELLYLAESRGLLTRQVKEKKPCPPSQ